MQGEAIGISGVSTVPDPTGTAMADQDYESAMIPITLQPRTDASTSSYFCGSLLITNDNLVEEEECLGVKLALGEGTTGVLVFGSPINATVCIEDDDKGVCTCVCVCVCVCMSVYLYVF